jgi:hypothetical protein
MCAAVAEQLPAWQRVVLGRNVVPRRNPSAPGKLGLGAAVIPGEASPAVAAGRVLGRSLVPAQAAVAVVAPLPASEPPWCSAGRWVRAVAEAPAVRVVEVRPLVEQAE